MNYTQRFSKGGDTNRSSSQGSSNCTDRDYGSNCSMPINGSRYTRTDSGDLGSLIGSGRCNKRFSISSNISDSGIRHSFGRSERSDNTSPLTIDVETCGKYHGEVRIDKEAFSSGKSINICI
jgi:hypothetical protein